MIFSPDRVQIGLADGSYLDAVNAGGGLYRASLSGGLPRSLDDLVHPYLAPIAALVHRWRGVPALHGAALSNSHGAIGLIGQRESGKSTTAEALIDSGMWLLSDDLIVLEEHRVLPGPLSVDLRPAGAQLLQTSGDWVRGGERLRRLAPEPSIPAGATTLQLLVHLAFGPTTRVHPIPAAHRLTALASQLYWPGIGSPARDLLELTTIPQFIIERPFGAQGLKQTLQIVNGLIGEF